MTFIQAKKPAEYSELLNEAKTANVMLMHAALDLMPADTKHTLVALQSSGYRIAIELAMDERDIWTIFVTAVSPAGTRRVIADLAKSATTSH